MRSAAAMAAFFVSALWSISAFGALDIIFRGDFETGEIRTPASGGVVDYWFHGGSTLPDSNDTCEAGGNNPSLNISNRVVTDVVRYGTYANVQRLYWPCDYRPLNGGTLQKPRNSLTASNSAAYLNIGQAYWFHFSLYVPDDFVTDSSSLPTNLFQLHKSQPRTQPAKINVLEEAGDLIVQVADTDGNTSHVDEYTWTTNKGEWNDILVNFKPCHSGAASCGFLHIYLSNSTRRGAGTEKTAIFTDTGPNAENSDTYFKISPNLYKYNWHCTGDTRSNYNACMTEPPPSGTLTYDAGTGEALPLRVYFDHVILAEAADSDDIDDAIAAIATDFSSGAAAPSNVVITAMNQGNPLDVNDFSYFTGNGVNFRGVDPHTATISDGINTESMDGVISNSNGGCFTLGDVTTVNGGNVTTSFAYKTPDYDTDEDANNWGDWGTSSAAIGSYDGADDACFGTSSAIAIENSSGTALINMNSDDRVDVVSGDIVRAHAIMEEGTTGAVRFRVQCDSNDVEVSGTLGSLADDTFAATETGTGHTFTELVSRGVSLMTIQFTANATETCQIKLGTNVGGTAKVYAHLAQIWKDYDSTTTVTFDTTLNKADVIAPSIEDCDLASITTSSASLSCNLGEMGGTFYAVLTDSATSPSVEQVKAGQDHTGAAAMFSGSLTPDTLSESFTATGLDPLVNKYAYFVHTDASSNDSNVAVAENFITGETDPGTTSSIKFDETNGRLKRGGSLFTGSFDHFKLYDANPLLGSATLLAHAEDVSVTSGAFTLQESDLTSGSINQLEAATDYWWFAFDEDKDPFAFGEIQITVE